MVGEDFLKFNNGQKFSFSNFKEIKKEDLKNADAETKRLFNIFAGDDHILQANEAQSLWNKLKNMAATNGDNQELDDTEIATAIKELGLDEQETAVDKVKNLLGMIFTKTEEKTTKQTDDNGNTIETTITYENDKLSQIVKKQNGVVISTTTINHHSITANNSIEYVTLETTNSDGSKVVTNTLSTDSEGNVAENQFIDRTTIDKDGNKTIVYVQDDVLLSQETQIGGKTITTVYNGQSLEDYDNGRLNKLAQQTEENGEIRVAEYDGNGNTRTIVQNGESPALIAQRFNVKLNALMKLNPAKGNNAITQVGADILIPGEFAPDSKPMRNRKTKDEAVSSFAQGESARLAKELYTSEIVTTKLTKDYKNVYEFARSQLIKSGIQNPTNEQVNTFANKILLLNGNIQLKPGVEIKFAQGETNSDAVKILSQYGFKPSEENYIFYQKFNKLSANDQKFVLSIIKNCKTKDISSIKAAIMEQSGGEINLFDSDNTVKMISTKNRYNIPAYQLQNNKTISIETFVKDILGLDLKAEPGKTILERLAQIPQEALDNISAKGFQTLQDKSFDSIANILESAGVQIRTQDELNIRNNSPRAIAEREKREEREFAAESVALAYDSAINTIKQYQGSQGWLNVGYWREKLGKALDKINPTDIATCFEAVIRRLEKERDLAVLTLKNSSGSESQFRAAFKEITGGRKYDVEAVKAFQDAFAKANEAGFQDEKLNSAYIEKYNQAFGIKKVVKGKTVYTTAIEEWVNKKVNFQSYVDGAGDIVAMLIGTEAISKGLVWAGGKASAKLAPLVPKAVSKTVTNVGSKSFLGLKIGGNSVTVGNVATQMALQSANFTLWEGGKGLVNLYTKENSITDEDWKMYKEGVVESAKFGAFAGILNSTLVGKVVSGTMKVFEKPAAKATKEVAAALEKSGKMSGSDIMKTFFSKQTPGLVANSFGTVTDVAGFTAYETVNEIAEELMTTDKNGERHLPENLTEDGLFSYVWEKLKGQAVNLGEIKAISKLLFMHKGAILAREAQLQKNLAKCENLKNIELRPVEINGHTVLELKLPNGNREIVTSVDEAIAKCNVIMNLDMIANAAAEADEMVENGVIDGINNSSVTTYEEAVQRLKTSNSAREGVDKDGNKVIIYHRNALNMGDYTYAIFDNEGKLVEQGTIAASKLQETFGQPEQGFSKLNKPGTLSMSIDFGIVESLIRTLKLNYDHSKFEKAETPIEKLAVAMGVDVNSTKAMESFKEELKARNINENSSVEELKAVLEDMQNFDKTHKNLSTTDSMGASSETKEMSPIQRKMQELKLQKRKYEVATRQKEIQTELASAKSKIEESGNEKLIQFFANLSNEGLLLPENIKQIAELASIKDSKILEFVINKNSNKSAMDINYSEMKLLSRIDAELSEKSLNINPEGNLQAAINAAKDQGITLDVNSYEFKQDVKLEGFKEFVDKYSDSNKELTDYLYEKYYLADKSSEIQTLSRELAEKYGTYAFVRTVDDIAPLKMLATELNEMAQASNGKANRPACVDFSELNQHFISGNASGYSSGKTVHALAGKYDTLRHEIMHQNDPFSNPMGDGCTYEQLGEVLSGKYAHELRKAGLSEDEIIYAHTSRAEYLAVLSQGDLSKVSNEFKQVLIEHLGMPEWAFNLKPHKIRTELMNTVNRSGLGTFVKDFEGYGKIEITIYDVKTNEFDYKLLDETIPIKTHESGPSYKLIDPEPAETDLNIINKRFEIRDKLEQVAPDELATLQQSLGENFYHKIRWEDIIPENATESEIKSILQTLNEDSKFFARTGISEEKYGKNIQWAHRMNEISNSATQRILAGENFESVIGSIAKDYKAYDENAPLPENADIKEAKADQAARATDSGRFRGYGTAEVPASTKFDNETCYNEYYDRLVKVDKYQGKQRTSPYPDIKLAEIVTLGEAGRIIHPENKYVNAGMKHASEKYNELKPLIEKVNRGKKLTPAEKEFADKQIAEMYFILANTMPYQRGSNGISDVLMRSIYKALGIEQPALRKGVSLDLEAFCVNMDKFAANWNSFFENEVQTTATNSQYKIEIPKIKSLEEITTPINGRVRNKSELTSEDVIALYNDKMKVITPDDINEIIMKYPESDSNIVRILLQKMGEFADLDSLNSLYSQIEKQGLTLISAKNNTSLSDIFSYLTNKKAFDNDIVELHENFESGIIKMLKQGKKPCLIIDASVMNELENSPALRKLIQDNQDKITLILPYGWHDGVTTFNHFSKQDIATKLNALLPQVKQLMQEGNVSIDYAITQVLNSKILNKLETLGLKADVIENQNINRTLTSDNIAKQYSANSLSESDIEAILSNFSEENRPYVLEIMAQTSKPSSMASLAARCNQQYQSILDMAFRDDIPEQNVYYLVPTVEAGEGKKSYGMISTIYRDTNNVPVKQFINDISEIPDNQKTMVVILDDFSGSGKSLIDDYRAITNPAEIIRERVEKQVKKAIENGAVIQDVNEYVEQRISEEMSASKSELLPFNTELKKFGGKIVIAPLSSTSGAGSAIENFAPYVANDNNLTFMPAETIPLFLESEYFKNLPISDKRRFQIILEPPDGFERFGPKGDKGKKWKSPNDPLGYYGFRGNATSIVFPYMAPNNNNAFYSTYIAPFLTLNGAGIKNRWIKND